MSDIDRTDSALVRYGIAILAVMFSTIAYLLLEEATGAHVAPSLFLPGVLASLFYGGVGPGYCAAVLSAAAVSGFAMSSPTHFALPNLLRIGIASAGFLMACALVQGRERKIRDSMRSLSSALAGAVEGVVRIDRTGRIADADEHFAELVGGSSLGLRGRPLLELIVAEDREKTTRAARQCWAEGKADVDVRILWRRAAPHEVHMMLSRSENAQGRASGIYCFMKDNERTLTGPLKAAAGA